MGDKVLSGRDKGITIIQDTTHKGRRISEASPMPTLSLLQQHRTMEMNTHSTEEAISASVVSRCFVHRWRVQCNSHIIPHCPRSRCRREGCAPSPCRPCTHHSGWLRALPARSPPPQSCPAPIPMGKELVESKTKCSGRHKTYPASKRNAQHRTA